MQTLKIKRAWEAGKMKAPQGVMGIFAKYLLDKIPTPCSFEIDAIMEETALGFYGSFNKGPYQYFYEVGDLTIELPERKLKPVDLNCLFKPVLVNNCTTCEDCGKWITVMLVRISEFGSKMVQDFDENGLSEWSYRKKESCKRIEDYDYGDGGNWDE